jgi:hypothetical protein
MILKTEKSTKSKMLATGILAIPLLKYSVIISNWHEGEIQKMDRKTSKVLTAMDSITHEQTLIICKFPEKREEEDQCR